MRARAHYLIINRDIHTNSIRFYDILPYEHGIIMPRDIAINESILIVSDVDDVPEGEVVLIEEVFGGKRFYV